MNFRILVISSLFFISCTSNIGAGTLGGWETKVFPVTNSKLDSGINALLADHPEYIVPEKWKFEEESWKRRGYDFLKSTFFYFKDTPEEMFFISYIDAGFGARNTNSARIAIRSVYTQKRGWGKKEGYSEKEQDRIQKRFEREIISKLEEYLKVKSSTEK